jgi:hypothetical protein
MDPTPGSVWLRLCGGQTGREGNGSFEGVLGSQRRQYLCRSEMRPTGEGNPKVNGMGEEEEYQTCRRSRKLQILLGPTDTHTHTHPLKVLLHTTEGRQVGADTRREVPSTSALDSAQARAAHRGLTPATAANQSQAPQASSSPAPAPSLSAAGWEPKAAMEHSGRLSLHSPGITRLKLRQ